ncbi:unnamed protein product [Urochloa humidicola]
MCLITLSNCTQFAIRRLAGLLAALRFVPTVCCSPLGIYQQSHVVLSARGTRLNPFSKWRHIKCDTSAICYLWWSSYIRGLEHHHQYSITMRTLLAVMTVYTGTT